MDDEPYIKFNPQGGASVEILDEFQIPHHVEIHYAANSNKPMKAYILTNVEIDLLVAKYGCKL